jgi:L-ascorbate metabolism protein UlaG (beta-lactamase superfamily)
MDPAAAREEEIAQTRQQLIQDYPVIWRRMIADLSRPSSTSRGWLMYSANYLFRTGSVRWAIDPVRLKHRVPVAPEMDYARDLGGLSFVLLTHSHGDHLDLELIRRLSHQAITWVVPEPMVELVQRGAGLQASQIVTPHPLQPIELFGVKITPFEGLHWDGEQGVPEVGYLAEFCGERWLFPGDTRRYDVSALPIFGPVDALLAHVWLGRGAALEDPPPLLESFCQWCVDLRARRVLLTHLDEFGRGCGDYWTVEHAGLAVARMKALRPGIAVLAATIGSSVAL